MTIKKSRAIPTSRLSRLTKLGSFFGSVAAQVVIGGVSQAAQGHRPALGDLILTPRNMHKLAEKLSHMRGAAMKLGQLLSMDAGEVLPEELAEILAVLRDAANPMTNQQLEQVLRDNWGKDWLQQFSEFEMQPFAAASIGQVHRAKTLEGKWLAVKVQYPGVDKAIHSDVDNLGALLKLTHLVPPQLNLSRLLAEVKAQLEEEANYEREADYLRRYAQHTQSMKGILIPDVDDVLSTQHVLAMTYVDAISLTDTLSLAQSVRDDIGLILTKLLIEELFEYRLLQSDPNLANYLYHPQKEKVVLLDFGATRAIPENISDAYRALLIAVFKQDVNEVLAVATELGFFGKDMPFELKSLMLQITKIASEPLRYDGHYDFGAADIASRIQPLSQAMIRYRTALAEPPVDALFIHRKIGGLYLLLSKLKARVNIRALILPWL